MYKGNNGKAYEQTIERLDLELCKGKKEQSLYEEEHPRHSLPYLFTLWSDR